jgi:hypothetical protein
MTTGQLTPGAIARAVEVSYQMRQVHLALLRL